MRLVGRISGWNDDKGYGFVVPHDGGDRAFVHIKAFQSGSRRPVDGDLISYSAIRDGRGRTNAAEIRFAGQRIEARKQAKPVPRLAIASLFLLALVAGSALGVLPAVVPIGYVFLGCLSLVMYSLDKAAAEKDMRRTPESTLHFVDLLGGWPGALVAQQLSRHKTVKASFQAVFWLTVFANVAAVAWLVHSGIARGVTAALLGSH